MIFKDYLKKEPTESKGHKNKMTGYNIPCSNPEKLPAVM